jgi:tetratricopeptide (TPR) repeat protein
VGDEVAARSLIDESLAVARAADSQVGMLMTLNLRADLDGHLGDFAGIVRSSEQALAIARESGDRDLLSAHLHRLAFALYQVGDRERARICAEEAIELHREGGRVAAGAAAVLTACALDEGRWEAARELSTELLAGMYGAWFGRRTLLVILARCAAARGDLERAARIGAAAEHFASGLVVAPADRRALDDVAGAAREALGTAAFEAARERGGTMSIEEALADAIMTGPG